MIYYDAEADIVYVALRDGEIARSVEHKWGLLDVDAAGETVGAEYWHASEGMPAELLATLPAPPHASPTPLPRSAA
jgi:uncharacterized protein YuzE